MSQLPIESTFIAPDEAFEVPLRPQSLDDFLGQESVKERLSVLITAAKQRGETLGHCLFSGPPGLGKTTLANILAQAMGTRLVVTSGPAIEKAGDLAGLLTNLQEGDVLFIDELHRLSRVVEEYLYPAMEDYTLDLMIDSGPNARSVQLKLNRFTLVGATTQMGQISSPMRSRFHLHCRLDYYTPDVLVKILARTSRLLDLELDPDALDEVARRSRGTPRIGNHLLRWVRDVAQVQGTRAVTQNLAAAALDQLKIDGRGLDEMDLRLLRLLVQTYNGGPVGLGTLSVALGESRQTLEEVHEPYLIQLGLLERTPRGRQATSLACQYIDLA